MKKNLNLLILSILFIFIFLGPQMHSSKAMEEEMPITFIRPNGTKMLMKVYPDRPLSDLRSELADKGRISPDDVFQREGCDIFLDDEKYWKVREVLVDKTLFLKPRGSGISQLLNNSESQSLQKREVALNNNFRVNIEIITDKETELREKQKIFSIWGSDIDMSLQQYGKLVEYSSGTYDEMLNILTVCLNLYNTRQEIAGRYMYNSEGLAKCAMKIIENNQLTVQSINKIVEDLSHIKGEEEQKRIIHLTKFSGSRYEMPDFSYTDPRVKTLSLLHNQLQDEFCLHMKLFEKPHPSKEKFIEIINKIRYGVCYAYLEEHSEQSILATNLMSIIELHKRKEYDEYATKYIELYLKNDHSTCTTRSGTGIRCNCQVATGYNYNCKKNYQTEDVKKWYKIKKNCPKNPDRDNCIVS